VLPTWGMPSLISNGIYHIGFFRFKYVNLKDLAKTYPHSFGFIMPFTITHHFELAQTLKKYYMFFVFPLKFFLFLVYSSRTSL
jgi:hypothetical protein